MSEMLLQHRLRRAQEVTERAKRSRCINRWYIACDYWEKFFSLFPSVFKRSLYESAFVAEYLRWRKDVGLS